MKTMVLILVLLSGCVGTHRNIEVLDNGDMKVTITKCHLYYYENMVKIVPKGEKYLDDEGTISVDMERNKK